MLTPFPGMVKAVISESILGRSAKKERIKFHIKEKTVFSKKFVMMQKKILIIDMCY